MNQVYVDTAQDWYERAVKFRGRCVSRFRHARVMMWLALFKGAYEERS